MSSRHSNGLRNIISTIQPNIETQSRRTWSRSRNFDTIDLTEEDDDTSIIDLTSPVDKNKFNADDSFDEGSKILLQKTCPICLETLHDIIKSGKEIKSTFCGHIFCEECVMLAIKTSRSCPTCRKPLNEKKIHPLYLPTTAVK